MTDSVIEQGSVGAGRDARDREVEPAFQQPSHQRTAGLDLHRDRHARTCAPHVLDGAHHRSGCRPGDRADGHLPRGAGAHGVQLLCRRPQLDKHGAGTPDQHLAVEIGLHAARQPLEQGGGEHGFDVCKQLGGGRLGDG